MVTSGLTGDESIAITNVRKIFFPGMPVAPMPGDMLSASALAAPDGNTAETPQTDDSSEGQAP